MSITKKKIAIISINAHTRVLNFASPLHSYAFQKFLTKHRIKSVIVDYKPCYYKEFDVRRPYDHYLKHPKENPDDQKKTLEFWKNLYDAREKRFDRFQEFIDKYYIKTDKCYNQNTLDTEDIGCDIYMSVTDVLWKYHKQSGFDRGYFLACDSMKGKTKIAYAASKGAGKYADMPRKQAIEYINDIDYVSCREESLQKFVNKNTNKKAALVLDPVFLQKASFYKRLAIRPKEKGYLLLYAVMDDAHTLADEALKFAKKEGLDVIDVSDDCTISYISPYGERKAIYDIGIEEWLGYMLNAKYIFTNSFHCCCFSIIFKKVFFVGKRGGDKITSLLKQFDLDDRRLEHNKGVYTEKNYPSKEIDFAPVHEKLKIRRKESITWLFDTLKNCN